MSIGKYVTNPGVIGSIFGAFGTAKQAQEMPKDWRRYIVWGVWGAGLLLAIVGVSRQQDEDENVAEQKNARRELKAQAKALRKHL